MAELRSRTAETRYRLPDVSALLAAPQSRYLTDAAYLVVEVLSERDVMSAVVEKLRECAAKSVPNIWVVDPRLRLSVYRPPALVEVHGETLATLDGAVALTAPRSSPSRRGLFEFGRPVPNPRGQGRGSAALSTR